MLETVQKYNMVLCPGALDLIDVVSTQAGFVTAQNYLCLSAVFVYITPGNKFISQTKPQDHFTKPTVFWLMRDIIMSATGSAEQVGLHKKNGVIWQ